MTKFDQKIQISGYDILHFSVNFSLVIALAEAKQAQHAAHDIGMGYLALTFGHFPGNRPRQVAVAVDAQSDQVQA